MFVSFEALPLLRRPPCRLASPSIKAAQPRSDASERVGAVFFDDRDIVWDSGTSADRWRRIRSGSFETARALPLRQSVGDSRIDQLKLSPKQ